MQDTPSFELASYKDLFIKARYDLGKLDELVNSYDLYNYLCTINHLYDWVKKETNVSPPERNKGGTLEIVRLLCNRAKHFDKVNAPDTEVKKGFGTGRFGVGLFGVGEPSYLVTIGDKQINLLTICKDAFDIWEKFLLENNLIDYSNYSNSLAKLDKL